MPALRNPKHEAVLQAWLADRERVGWRAYKSVYARSSKHAAEVAWSRLLKDAEFAARRAELAGAVLDQVVVAAGVTLQKVIDELALLGFANMLDYIRIAESGDPVLDFTKLSREQAAAIGEVTVETYKEGHGKDARDVKRVRFKLHDKKGPLSELRRHFEPDKHQHEHSGKPDGDPIQVEDTTDELAIARRVAFLLSRAARRPPGKSATGAPAQSKRARHG